MKQIRYDELADFLRTGREIEFGYKGKSYSITNNTTGYWYLCQDTDAESIIIDKVCPYKELDYLAEKIAGMIIEDVTIRRMFDELLYDESMLHII